MERYQSCDSEVRVEQEEDRMVGNTENVSCSLGTRILKLKFSPQRIEETYVLLKEVVFQVPKFDGRILSRNSEQSFRAIQCQCCDRRRLILNKSTSMHQKKVTPGTGCHGGLRARLRKRKRSRAVRPRFLCEVSNLSSLSNP